MVGVVAPVLLVVHCRTGSLERQEQDYLHPLGVHCRTGSLENSRAPAIFSSSVHCRTGSLENKGTEK